MFLATFDKWAGIVLAASFGFSWGAALAEWHWFPIPGDWGI
jgi:hypothetical protein